MYTVWYVLRDMNRLKNMASIALISNFRLEKADDICTVRYGSVYPQNNTDDTDDVSNIRLVEMLDDCTEFSVKYMYMYYFAEIGIPICCTPLLRSVFVGMRKNRIDTVQYCYYLPVTCV